MVGARFVVFLLLSVQVALAQKTITVTQSEPGVMRLERLRAQSDTVALVKIVAGDTENYDVAVYKAEVIKSYKGATVGQTIYFGPFLGTRLGWEYVVFLYNKSEMLSPKTKSPTGFGRIRYGEIFNEGYSSMETSYECVFDGDNSCDYGVRVCTDYIKLPQNVPVFPSMSEEVPFGCRWVRKSLFLSLLMA
jgi:hypothetical protein